MESDLKFKSNQQLYIAWRRILAGYDGYQYPPNFTEEAFELLRTPETGKADFAKYFGDYYVKGCVMGASMKMVVRTVGTSTSSS